MTTKQKPARGGKYAAPRSRSGVTLCTVLLLLSFVLFFAARWFVSVYGQIGFDAVLFTLQSSLSGVESELIFSFLFLGLLPALLLGGITAIVLFTRTGKKRTIRLGKMRLILFPLKSGAATVLSILLSLMVGMFLFMMIPMLSPLDATLIHVLGCAVGGLLLGIGFGAISNAILKKTSLV